MLTTHRQVIARKFVRASSTKLESASTPLTAPPMTLACWVASSDTTNSQDVLCVHASGTGSGFRLNLGGNATGDPVRAVTTQSGSAIATSGTYIANQWLHAAAVFASSTSRTAYANGVAGTTETTSTVPTGVDKLVVGLVGTVSNPLDGMVAIPCIWNVALSAHEILLLARGANPLAVRPESIVAFWDFNGNEVEHGYQAKYPLVNSGSFPVTSVPLVFPVTSVSGIGRFQKFSAVLSVELTADSITSGNPSTGSASLTQIHALTGTSIASGTPELSAPQITQAHSISGGSIASGTPQVSSSSITQLHALSPTGISSGTPQVGSSSITQSHSLTVSSIAAGTPSTETATLSQLHVLTSSSIASGVPQETSPQINQVQALSAGNTTSGVPQVDVSTISQVHVISSTNIAAGTTQAGQGTISQLHVFSGSIVSGIPTVASSQVSQQHALVGSSVVAGSGEAGSSQITQQHVLQAGSISCGQPGSTECDLGQAHTLSSSGISSGSPSLGAGNLFQHHILSALPVVSGVPTVSLASLLLIKEPPNSVVFGNSRSVVIESRGGSEIIVGVSGVHVVISDDLEGLFSIKKTTPIMVE